MVHLLYGLVKIGIMEKQPFLPIKFYPVRAWQEYNKFKEYSRDKVIVKEHYAMTPAFHQCEPSILTSQIAP